MDGKIETLLPDGDGQCGATRVPGGVPGDTLRGGELEAGPNRAEPLCAHAGACGGCTFQHVSDQYLGKWKQDRVAAKLEAAGLTAPMRALHVSPPGARRRATFSGRRTKKTVQLGYLAKASDLLVDISQCPVVRPEIEAALDDLRAATQLAASRKGVIRCLVTTTDSGLDLAITGAREIAPEALSRLAAMDWARVSWNGEVVLQARPPVVRFGGIAVCPPPGAFLQATEDGERALRGSVQSAVGDARRVADLFSGCGTFALPLSRDHEVDAYDTEEEMVGALATAHRTAAGLKPLKAERRDLFRRPLLAQELKAFDAVVLDPPRAGAAAQIAELGQSQVPVIAYVSCDPTSFARDAGALVAAGYRLDWVDVVDQFKWSSHVETAARFSLPR